MMTDQYFTPARLLISGIVITVANFVLANTLWAEDRFAADGPVVVMYTYLTPPARVTGLQAAFKESDIAIQFLPVATTEAEAIETAVATAKLVLVDIPHVSVLESVAEKLAASFSNHETPFLLVGDSDQVRSGQPARHALLNSNSQIPSSWAGTVRRYYRFGGKFNDGLLAAAFTGPLPDTGPQTELLAAKPFPAQGLYHPEWPELIQNIEEVADRWEADDNPVIAIAINSSVLSTSDTGWLDEMIAQLELRGLHAYACYGPRSNINRFRELTQLGDPASRRRFADLMINAALVFKPQQIKVELDEIGIPVLQTLPALAMNVDAWRSSKEGLAMADISYYLASSELAGMVDPMLVTARNPATGLLQPLSDQIISVADRAAAICRLQRSPPRDRRVAMMVYNYPPGENNFGASFLNVPKSIVSVISQMKTAGYSTEIPTEQGLLASVQAALRGLYDSDVLLDQHVNGQADLLSLDDYLKWYIGLPANARSRIEAYWGPPSEMTVAIASPGPGSVAGAGDATKPTRGFLIPSVTLGNVRVLPQPLRYELTAAANDETRKKRINHHSAVPLSHAYLATYVFLRQQWRADAIVHFGTHGTLEWAPGKSRGLSVSDDSFLALGAIPNLYPYIMDNLGEATTAKRRGRATMISHLTPMFSPAGFQPGLHSMHDLMHDWETIEDGPVRKEMERQLIEQFTEHKLERALDWTADRIASDFHGFMEVLHPYLDDIAQSAQPLGLARLGEVPSAERRFGMVMQMLRKPLIDALGEDIDEVFLIDADKVVNSRPARWLRLALQDAEAASTMDLRKIDALDLSQKSSVPNRAVGKRLDPAQLLALAHRAQTLEKSLSQNNEIESLLAGLGGEHIPSRYGGDPVRNPDSLPTGGNLYGFDPTRVPTRQAWEIGTGVLDRWIESYQDEHDGQFPRQIAFTMWAGETMRHQGVMESQIFHAIGVRPIWNDAGRIKGVEVVPSAAIDRPRIDVLLSVTGSYRDQFPQLMTWIDQAVRDVASLEESATGPGNFVAENVTALRAELIARGESPKVATRQATARVFSNESGVYGTGVNNAAYASDLWDSQTRGGGDAEMASLFVQRMGYAYGKGLGGVSSAELFSRQLANVDAAFLSRSSNTYGVLTSDDPFAYLGGFSLAARVASGRTPELYVQNLRDTSEVIIDPAGRAIGKEMRTRYLHPKWIRAQQAEGYSGTLQVLKATQFLWGWQVTAPESIREDHWQSMMEVYVNDQYDLGAREWLQRDNQAAFASMMEKMIDAVRLDYWNPDQITRETLMQAYLQSKSESDLIESNRLVAQYVDQELAKLDQAQPSPGVDPKLAESIDSASLPSTTNPDQLARKNAAKADASVRVKGLKLEPVAVLTDVLDPQSSTTKLSSSLSDARVAVVAIVFLVMLGSLLQYRKINRMKVSK